MSKHSIGVSFLTGILIGYQGVRITTHIMYLTIIGSLLAAHFYL